MTKRIILILAGLLTAWQATLAADAPLKIFLAENDVLCVRATEISEQFAEQFRAAAPTNFFSGIVVDLRMTGGRSEKGVADFLLARKVPLAVLADAQTQGAAATLASELHAAGAVVIASGTNSAAKVAADIQVSLSAEAEKRFLENPFTNPAAGAGDTLSGTNLMFYSDHTSEAELVRKRVKDGEEEDVASPRSQPSQPVIYDPALARAVDLLKALSVLRHSRG